MHTYITATLCLMALILAAQPVAGGEIVEAISFAEPSSDPGFEGWYKYEVSIRWIIEEEQRFPASFWIDLREFKNNCQPGEDVGWYDPAGFMIGVDENFQNCQADYGAEYFCWDERSLPFVPLGSVIFLTPFDTRNCLATNSGDMIFWFYSKLAPRPSRLYQNAVRMETPLRVVFGHLDGDLPGEEGQQTPAEVVINEFLVKPPGGVKEFYELFNRTYGPIDLTNWDLQTAFGTLDNLVGILPGQDYLFDDDFTEVASAATWMSDAVSSPQDFGNAFNDVGDLISLRDPQGVTVDEVGYGALGGAPISCPLVVRSGNPPPFSPGMVDLEAAASFDTFTTTTSRAPDGTDSGNHAVDFNVGEPTPDAANSAETAALGTSIRINSIYAAQDNKDAVEFFNPLGGVVTITDWFLSDGSLIQPIFHNPDSDVPLEPGGTVSILQGMPYAFNFELDFDDVLYLYRSDLTRIDQMGWSQVPVFFPDSCLQRVPDGAGPADGYDWITSGGGVTLFYDECPLMVPNVGVEPFSLATALALPTPNPSTGPITFSFQIASSPRAPRSVQIGLYNVSGRRIRTLGQASPWTQGSHNLIWDGQDDQGTRVAPGVYFARLVVNGQQVGPTRSVIWLNR